MANSKKSAFGHRPAWTWLDVLLVVRAFVLWCLMIGQGGLYALHFGGVALTVPIVVWTMLIGGVVGFAGHAVWTRLRPV